MSGWPLLLLVAVDALAVHRLTRLVTADVVTARPRRAVIAWAYRRAGYREILDRDLEAMVDADMEMDPCDVPRPAVLVVCPHCASVWLAAVAVAGHALAPVVWFPLAAVLALSAVSSLLAALED